MNFKHETNEWGNHTFIRVSKKRYDNFIRYFKNLKKIEGNSFMGWNDFYDWSLNNNLDKCMVARHYFETPEPEYWIRLDYIEANKYDLDTIVPKPHKKRMTKKEKQFAEVLAKAFNYAFAKECEEQFKK